MHWMWIVVARIAPEPIVLGTAVSQYRARGEAGARSTPLLADAKLPPILRVGLDGNRPRSRTPLVTIPDDGDIPLATKPAKPN